ncbi:hypothetical protein KBC86_00200 [Candidatus Gracilibacteria bacterium]|nr:hypothetical protein [Candidatus Gracilibacteria bacterium]
MHKIKTPDYSSFSESFDDLYEQIDEEHKYLIQYLRESIPLEAGYRFFDILGSILHYIYYNNHGVYPSADNCFQLTKEYIGRLFREGKIKVKLSTPVPLFDTKTGKVNKYDGGNEAIYDNPDFAEDLMNDMQERYEILSLMSVNGEDIDMNRESEIVQMYHGFGIIISYDKKPFYDEL